MIELIKIAGKQIYGLFIDDDSLAVAVAGPDRGCRRPRQGLLPRYPPTWV